MNVAQEWRGWIENAVDLPADQPYSAIIGSTPSRGARSPRLWNRAYEATKTPGKMIAMDVSSATRVEDLMAALEKDPLFKGGAVTMPYKEVVAQWLGPDRLEPAAAPIGAVNALFRDASGELRGSNTDGAAALASLQNLLLELENKRCGILGLGGVGKAVAAYLASAKANLVLVARDPNRHQKFATDCNGALLPWPLDCKTASNLDVLVNCTSLGSQPDFADACPVSPDVVAALPAQTVVFDVIYDPPQTLLLKLAQHQGLVVLNGLEMNLLQASLAFNKAHPKNDLVAIYCSIKGQ
jgi:shikimate dehydrogenase